MVLYSSALLRASKLQGLILWQDMEGAEKCVCNARSLRKFETFLLGKDLVLKIWVVLLSNSTK
ncbi:unnamed protein product, partial [Linum tenue]